MTFTRDGWECRILPSPTKSNSIKFLARSGARIINIELHANQADTFSPATYWNIR